MLINCECQPRQISVFGSVFASPEMKVHLSEAAATQQNGIQPQSCRCTNPHHLVLNDAGTAAAVEQTLAKPGEQHTFLTDRSTK